jgi:hypothetical protein
VADGLVAKDPIAFLTQLQTAVASSNTPPLSPAAQALSDEFNRLFGNGRSISQAQRQDFVAGTQDAHAGILNSYLSSRGPTNWIHFTNIGAWGDNVVDRAAITEFIQYGNGIKTAAYYHAFRDEKGRPLDGDDTSYVLTFPAGQSLEAERVWSISAYTPEAIELIPNPKDKYVVARYTPGLEPNPDGSISIYMADTRPVGVPESNWLPIHRRQFIYHPARLRSAGQRYQQHVYVPGHREASVANTPSHLAAKWPGGSAEMKAESHGIAVLGAGQPNSVSGVGFWRSDVGA